MTWRLLYKCYIDFHYRLRITDDLYKWCGLSCGSDPSLIKYVAFINNVLVSLKASNLCCAIVSI